MSTELGRTCRAGRRSLALALGVLGAGLLRFSGTAFTGAGPGSPLQEAPSSLHRRWPGTWRYASAEGHDSVTSVAAEESAGEVPATDESDAEPGFEGEVWEPEPPGQPPSAGSNAALVQEFLEIAAASDRGQAGDMMLKDQCEDAIAALEAVNPTAEPARSPLLDGDWRLVWASEDATRCSPFFWALRKSMRGMQDPNPISRLIFGSEELVENTMAFTDGIPIKTVGLATQRFSYGTLVNQVAVGVFLTGESKMTTTSSYVPNPSDPASLLVTVEKTQVLGASVAASFLDQIEFPSGEVLGEAAEVDMRISYLDERLRIVRDAQRPEALFAFVRA